MHETAQIVLPRLVRRSRLYEATAKNLLRIGIELVGGVPAAEGQTDGAGEVAVRKIAGNVVEFGSIAAFGFSPIWLLAAASDVLRGSRVYLDTLVAELAAAGVVEAGARYDTVDDLLGALENTSGRTASLLDIPPLELAELRRSVGELKSDVTGLPGPGELATLFAGLQRLARIERRTILEVSSGVGLAFLLSARAVTREHLVTPYREDWQPLRAEGFGAYSARVSGPYLQAIGSHFDGERVTWTERGIDRAATLHRSRPSIAWRHWGPWRKRRP